MKNIKVLVAGPKVTSSFNMAIALRDDESFTIDFRYANNEEDAMKELPNTDIIAMEKSSDSFEEALIKRSLELKKQIMIVEDTRYINDDLVCKVFHLESGVHSCM